jgi:primosomal protein N'
MNYKPCPKCDASLNILSSSGRQVCLSCKWTEPIEKILENQNL